MIRLLNFRKKKFITNINEKKIPENIMVEKDEVYFIKKNYSIIYSFWKRKGISFYSIKKFLKKIGIDEQLSLNNLPNKKFLAITSIISSKGLSNEQLYYQIKEYFTKYQSFINYKGWRHRNGLPVRGQRTRSNAKSCRHIIFNTYINKIYNQLLFVPKEKRKSKNLDKKKSIKKK